MRRPAAWVVMALALGAVVLVPRAAAQAQDAREGPREIEKCQTIGTPGSYKLVTNLVATDGDCLVITASFITVDLAGFSISHRGPGSGSAVLAVLPPSEGFLAGIAIRNGSINTSLFSGGVALGGPVFGSVVEGLRISGASLQNGVAILANGIVKGNTVVTFRGTGISATGTVTGNDVQGTLEGIDIGQGSTVIGNTASNNGRFGIVVACPANLTDNTAVNNQLANLVLNGDGCHNEDNLAP